MLKQIYSYCFNR